MEIEIIDPEWIREGAITVKLTDLDPHSVGALIETLRNATDRGDDERIRMLLRLWDALAGD